MTTKRITNKKIFFFVLIFSFNFFLSLITPQNVNAVDAWLYLENRRKPLYIKDIKFNYPKQNRDLQDAIILIKGQKKYHSYPFSEIRKINFKKLSGVQKMYPVFNVHISLRTPSYRTDAYLMPLKEVSGNHMGRKWKIDMKLYDTDILKSTIHRQDIKINKIVFKKEN